MKPIFILIWSLFSLGVFSQTARAMIDTTEISVGYPAHYIIQIQKDHSSDTFQFPQFVYKDSLASGLEILNITYDTIEIDSKPTYQQTIEFTAWEPGNYDIPPLVVKLKNDSISFNISRIKVTEPEVSDQINDIKDIIFDSPDLVYNILKNYPWVALGVSVFLLLIYYLWNRNKEQSNIPTVPKKSTSLADEYSLKLQKLGNRKLIENQKEKEFYNEYSSILKDYIEKKYHLPANDLFTSDLLYILEKNKVIPSEQIAPLAQLLQQADLAKYAKIIPSVEQGKQDIEAAIQWIYQSDSVNEPLNKSHE